MALLNLNIRGRLILGFGVLCALLAIVVGITIVKVRAVNEATEPHRQSSCADRDDRKRRGGGGLRLAGLAARLADHRQ